MTRTNELGHTLHSEYELFDDGYYGSNSRIHVVTMDLFYWKQCAFVATSSYTCMYNSYVGGDGCDA